MHPLDFGTTSTRTRTTPPNWAGLYWCLTLSVFTGTLAALVVFGCGVRLYLRWSIEDTMRTPTPTVYKSTDRP